MNETKLTDLILGRTVILQYSARKKAKSSPGQLTFDDLGGGRQLTFDDLGAGHWVTIGSEHGSNGSNHGGHRVFIGDDGKMKTGKFAGQSLSEAFGEKKPASKEFDTSPIPIRERRAVVDRLAAEGKAQAEIEEYLRARGVSISDSKRLSSQAGKSETKPTVPETTLAIPETKPLVSESKPGISVEVRTNETAKSGDQMGLFGDVSNVPKGKASLPTGGESKGLQSALFNTQGDPGQMMMFDDGVTSSDRLMPEAKSESRSTPKSSNRIGDFGQKIGGARKDTSTKLGPRAASAIEKDPELKGWRSRYDVAQVAKSTSRAEEGKWIIHDKKQKNWHGAPRQVGSAFDSKEEAEKAIPLIEVARNHRVYKVDAKGDLVGMSQPGTWAIVRMVSDTKRPVVKSGFESETEATRYMVEHPEEIIEHRTKLDDRIHPAIEKVTRDGKTHRSDGKQATPEDFKKFGFYGVEFGNWINNAEGKAVMNHAYDSFRDLADVLGLKNSDMSLGGDLGINWSRGQGLQGAKAHYERNYGTINLTKLKGLVPFLAHEWAPHDLDHYFGSPIGKNKIRSPG
ncbi:MAG: hypothetical protein U0930_04910 [Pirellulales bacterium]